MAEKIDKGLEAAEQRYGFDLESKPLMTPAHAAAIAEAEKNPIISQRLPQLDQMPIARQPRPFAHSLRTIPQRRTR